MRSVNLVVLAALIVMGSAAAAGASPGSVSGSVRDSSGTPQMGAVVQLLRPDMSVITSVYTNEKGQYTIPSVFPGHYSLKAMGTAFLPTLRENVRVRTGTVVNLTLNSLYEVMQWLPSQPRGKADQKDDWAWTLRSTANRPLLRWLEDGPLVVVSDGSGAAPKLKARLMATGQQGTFGESGQRYTAMVEDTPANSRELLARVDFAPNTDEGAESMLGFSQDLGFAGSVQSVAAVAIHPEIAAAGGDGMAGGAGLDEAAIRTSETLSLGDEIDAEVGETQMLARFAANSPNTVVAALPSATVGWHEGNSTFRYRMASMMPGPEQGDEGAAQNGVPQLSLRDGELAIEHGMHQEFGWERRTGKSSIAVLAYGDHIDNPILEAGGHYAGGGAEPVAVLYDPISGLLHAAGPNFTSAGMLASAEHWLPGGNQVRVSYANGNALTLGDEAAPEGLAQLLASAHPTYVQSYSISLSGTLDGSGTRWQASYRWQPENTFTSVAPFALNAALPYFSIRLRQRLHARSDGTGGLQALIDLRNLLAQGYTPYLLSDGSLLFFAQNQRGISGGLAFTF